MNTRDLATTIYNRINEWKQYEIAPFAIDLIEDELDRVFPDGNINVKTEDKE